MATAPEVWKGRKITIGFGTAITTVGTATTLEAQFTEVQGIEQVSLECTLEVPEKDAETTLLLGEDGTGAQNDILEDTTPTEAILTVTMLNDLLDVEQFQLTATPVDPAGFTRYNYGTDRPAAGVSAFVQFTDGTAIQSFLLNNARVIKTGGFEVEAEGNGESEFEIKCTPGNLYKERNY